MTNQKYLLGNALRVARLSRLMAKTIDLFIVLILSVFFFPFGILFAVFYLIICDSLQGGQSVGKKIIGFKVISLQDGTSCSVRQSFVRNLPLTIPVFMAIIPFWGWIIAVAIGIPLTLLEVYLLYKLDSGHRLGDVMADTTVIANDGQKLALKSKKSSWFDHQRQNV
ncbi:MAG: RDD family protein [Bdellovibrionota bacterium]